MKISYISYTKAQEALYLVRISGEGLGVGFPRFPCKTVQN